MRRAIIATTGALAVAGVVTVAVLHPTSAPQQTATATTEHEQPAVYEPPVTGTGTMEKEERWTTPANVNATATKTSDAMVSRTAVRASSAKVMSAITAATSATIPEKYHDTMFPGLTPEEERWTQATQATNTPIRSVSANSLSRTAASAASSATGESAPSKQASSNPCATIAAEYQSQCATAIRWRADIAQKFGAAIARHYDWLTAAQVDDWLKHGAGKQPADYFGAQGYDSPLGTCHSSTPTQRAYGFVCSGPSEALGCRAAGAVSTRGTLGGVLGADGKVRGWVVYPGAGAFVGTISDVECANGCAVEFDHPCSLPDLNVQPFWWRGKDGGMFATWWLGGDPSEEAGW